MPRRDRPSPALTSAAACLLLLGSWAAAQPGAAADAPVMDGVAVVSEGERVSLRWSLPGEAFPDGGFVLTRVAPDGQRTTVPVASPLPATLAPVAAETYEAAIELFDPTLAPVDDDEAFAIALLRATFALEAAADPDLARALGILVDHDDVALGERWRYEVATADGMRVGAAEITVGSTPPLDAPTGLVAEPATDGIGLRWTAADERTLVFGYRVEVRQPDGTFADLGGGWLTPPSVDDEDPDPYWLIDDSERTPGEVVTYRLIGRDLFGRETPPSATVAYTVTDPFAPPPAIIVDAQTGDRSITLRWAVEPDARVVAVAVLRAASLEDTPQLVSPLFPPDTDTWTDTGLRGGTDYYYAIAAFDAEGLATVGPAWAQRAVNPNPPGAPARLSADPRTDGFDLSWQAPPEDDVGRYQVYGGRPGTALADMTLLAETRATQVTVPVPENTLSDIAYRVRAVNTSDVTGPSSNEAVGRVLDATPPSAPLWLTVEGAEREIRLGWLRDLDPDVAHLRLLRATGPAADATAFAAIADLLPPDVTGYVDRDVVAGTLYTYRLEAVDASGNASEPSETRTAAAWDLTPPAPPADLRAEAVEGGVRLTWDAAPPATGWYVERAWQGAWVEVSDLLDAPGFTDARGVAGDRYRVTAVSAAGQASEGSEIEVPIRE
jgi:hypothetical protein